MPSRIFRIHIVNSTSSPLNRVAGDFHLHGAFTSGWDPPQRINPGESRAFQAESDGLFQGTDGHVTYEVGDGSPVADRFRVHWNNPFWGVTDSDPETLISTGVFDDRAAGDSPRYLFEGGGRRPLGTDPGSIITTGWAEIVPGLVALPVPMLGIEAHAWSAFSLRDRPASSMGVPSFGKSAPLPKLSFTPQLGAAPSSWSGTWVLEDNPQNPQVRVSISRAPLPSNPAFSTLYGNNAFSVNLEERSPRAGDPPLTVAQSGVRIEAATAMRYLGNTWPPRQNLLRVGSWRSTVTRQLAQAMSPRGTPAPAPGAFRSALGNLAGAQTVAQFAGLSDALVGSPAGGLVSQPLSTAGYFDHPGLSPEAIRIADEADGLVLDSARITLMLYAVHTESGQPLGNAVRYLRLGTGGETIADVMLLPAFQGPN